MTDIPTLIAELRRLGEAARIETLEVQETLDGSRYAIVDEFFPVSPGLGFITDRNVAAYLTAAANAVPLLCDEIDSLRHEVEKLRAALVPHSERLARLKAYESSPDQRGAT